MLLSVLVLKPQKKEAADAETETTRSETETEKMKQKKLKKKSKLTYLTNFLINIKALALNIEKIDGLWIMNQGLFLCENSCM